MNTLIIIKNVDLKKTVKYIFILLFVLSTVFLKAQMIDSSKYAAYTFIKTEINKIQNDSVSLLLFYQKLYQLEKEKQGRLNIVHIGDSHIQADGLSGVVRQKMQLKFGNAGRGFIFPYRLAKSNEPGSYKSSSSKIWEYKRNVFVDKPLPIGIGGYTIESKDSIAEINLVLKDQLGLGYAFTKFTLFHEKEYENFDITICDDLNCERGVFQSSKKSNNPFVSEITFDKPIKQIVLKNKCSDTVCQKSTRIYGMLVENDSSGVLYNMIGVNGAEYRHYNVSKYFTEQLNYLKPELVIVSLGTNEAFAGSFNKEIFYKQIDSMVNSIRIKNPNAMFILSTPSDSYKKSKNGRIKNPFVKDAQETIIKYALEHNLAYWDLLSIMGGWGSMQNWYLKQLSARDKVHFTSKGYQIQGDLLFNAIMDGYQKFSKTQQ